jgi:mevalonate kinase
MGIGRGFGKLLLFGEHAAVYGHPAVGVQLRDYLEVEVRSPRAGGTKAVDGAVAWRLPQLGQREQQLIRSALAQLPDDVATGVLEVRGTLPTSVGFGSSAAFCTALLRATGIASRLTARELWDQAHRLERVFHGTPSGIDTGLSVYEGVSLFRPNPPDLPAREAIRLPRATLVVGAVPRTSSTAVLVAGIRALRERDSAWVDATLDRLGELSRIAASAERCPDAAALGEAADEAHGLLSELNLSTPELDLTLSVLRAAGATGGKLSGAGGGGAFYAVYDSPESARLACETLETETAQAGVELAYLRRVELGEVAPAR